MTDVSIIPEDDNFDFVSTGLAQYLNNSYLQATIDPYQIGRKVMINYTGNVGTFSYTENDFSTDIAQMSSWDATRATAVAFIGGNIVAFVESMRSNGVFETEHGGKDIIYDGQGTGIVVANDGPAILVGGFGDDEMFGSGGDDEFYGGLGSDVIWGGASDQ